MKEDGVSVQKQFSISIIWRKDLKHFILSRKNYSKKPQSLSLSLFHRVGSSIHHGNENLLKFGFREKNLVQEILIQLQLITFSNFYKTKICYQEFGLKTLILWKESQGLEMIWSLKLMVHSLLQLVWNVVRNLIKKRLEMKLWRVE